MAWRGAVVEKHGDNCEGRDGDEWGQQISNQLLWKIRKTNIETKQYKNSKDGKIKSIYDDFEKGEYKYCESRKKSVNIDYNGKSKMKSVKESKQSFEDSWRCGRWSSRSEMHQNNI